MMPYDSESLDANRTLAPDQEKSGCERGLFCKVWMGEVCWVDGILWPLAPSLLVGTSSFQLACESLKGGFDVSARENLAPVRALRAQF